MITHLFFFVFVLGLLLFVISVGCRSHLSPLSEEMTV